MLVRAIVEPTGVDARIHITVPTMEHITAITAEQIITLLNVLKTLIAESAGKVISADISP